MKISSIKIKKVPPKNGHIGFASMVVDNWLYIGNIGVFSRLNDSERLRLVFPEKRIGETRIPIFYPLNSENYFELEKAVTEKFKEYDTTRLEEGRGRE